MIFYAATAAENLLVFLGQMFPMRLVKTKHWKKVPMSALIVPSIIGGSTTRVKNPFYEDTISLSSGPCKATLNRLDNGNNMLMLS